MVSYSVQANAYTFTINSSRCDLEELCKFVAGCVKEYDFSWKDRFNGKMKKKNTSTVGLLLGIPAVLIPHFLILALLPLNPSVISLLLLDITCHIRISVNSVSSFFLPSILTPSSGATLAAIQTVAVFWQF